MKTTADYTSLITSEHADKPKFISVVQALTEGLAGISNAMLDLPQDFDLDLAIGDQLDIVGQWVGIGRGVPIPLTGLYFSFDIVGVGFDQGVWQGPYDPTTGYVNLDDDSYRIMIKAKIGANHWDGTLGQLLAIMNQVFAGTGTNVFAVDNMDMSMTVGIAGVLPSIILISLLTGGFLVPKPETVHINYVTTSQDGAPIFGFDVQNQYIAGFDTGAWAQ